jgi:hypothetical protein
MLAVLSVWSFAQDQQSAENNAIEQLSTQRLGPGIDWAVVVAVSIPAVVTAIALFSVRKAIRTLACTQIAETVFRADTPEEAADRSQAIGSLFGEVLPMNVEMALVNPVKERLTRGGLPPYVVEARLGA